MSQPRLGMRQVVDWRAAFWAGLLGGVVFFLVSIVFSWLLLGDPWLYVRLIASLVLGPSVISIEEPFTVIILLVALAVLMLLSVFYASVVAFVVHRWGWVLSTLGGAILGLAFYVINFWTMSFLFPWVFPLRTWMLLLAHVAFGAFVGFIYELLEEEEYVPVDPVAS